MTAKLYDLDEDAEGAPRFVVDAYDHNLVVARLAEARELLATSHTDGLHWKTWRQWRERKSALLAEKEGER